MKMCQGCKWNMENQLSGFENNTMKMMKHGCDNREILEQCLVFQTCLELFAMRIISNIYTNFEVYNSEDTGTLNQS